MPRFTSIVSRLIRNEDGPTCVEYAFSLSLVLVACSSIITHVGIAMNSTFGQAVAASVVSGTTSSVSTNPNSPATLHPR
jgi:Flp pilus assembly pilin Flp